MGDWLEAGSPAADFTLLTDDGKGLTLSSLQGRPIVLYFYPRDDTPGCTREACGFRDTAERYSKHDAVVLGISPDDTESHAAFKTKYGLPFSLLADPDHRVAETYGAWREKTLYGKKRMGIARSTFIIDAQGNVAKVFKAVKVDGHAEQVLKVLDSLAD